MTKIIHLSDLHFGRQNARMESIFIDQIKAENPDFIIISGDFTQNAKYKEFANARNFLSSLPCAWLAVPGNHDLPSMHIMERFLKPYDRYKNYIHSDLCPTHILEDILITGLNSARRFLPHWNWANGFISSSQLDHIKRIDHQNASCKWKICVLHHPVQMTPSPPIPVKVFGASEALKVLHELKFDLVLTGHVHYASVSTQGDENHKTVYLSASTALSDRLRNQENGYNSIVFEGDNFTITSYALKDNEFVIREQFRHHRVK